MHFLDFISESPNLFIFQKRANQTNLGGIFFLIYISIVILIFIFYIHDFCQKEKYTFSYSLIEDFVFLDEMEKRYNSEEYNPTLNISFDLTDSRYNSLDERFFIIEDHPDGSISLVERNQFYQKNLYPLRLIIGFNCGVSDCKDFNITNLAPTNFFYLLHIKYIGQYIDHYGENSPFLEFPGTITIHQDFRFSYTNFYLTRLKWQPIEYYDEIGILDKIKGKKSKYFTGDIELKDSDIVDEEFNDVRKLFANEPEYKFLSYIIFYIDEHHIKYTRSKKNIWDTFGIICSLSSTIYTIMKLIFFYIYSTNFEPDKIIEKILLYKNCAGKNIREMEDLKDSRKFEPLINSSKEIILDTNVINDDNRTENENSLDDMNNDEEEIILPKFRMIHYLLNNIYSLKKWKSNKQEIISLCKEILAKYTSIDYLLFNQIKFDNLLKDYKWNNPKLRDIKENEFICKLKSKIDFETNNT